MNPSRTSFLRIALASATLTVVVSCSEGGSSPAPEIPSSEAPNASGLSVDFPADDADAARFLVQSSFGPSEAEISSVRARGYSAWLTSQAAAPASFFTSRVVARRSLAIEGDNLNNAATDYFWESAVAGQDQLRLRVAYALSQILVVSDGPGSPLRSRPEAMAYFIDILNEGALGSYRDLLEAVTYSPAMGLWLTYLGNEKANPATGSVPDENYAREIMQLFTIGLVQLNPDGTPGPGDIETYTNDDVIGLARVFTGLGYKGYRTNLGSAAPDALYSPMEIYADKHSPEEKSFLGTTIPADTPAAESIDRALDALFNHPNVGPFVGRQLIQRLVASNPSAAYVTRVASAFGTGRYTLPNGSSVGTGQRGDLLATTAAVLLDPEARQDPDVAIASFGKVREPVLRFTHWARAFDVRTARALEESWLADTSSTDRLGQHPFRAASVFNFYRPGFVAPGAVTGEQGLTAPELQIENEASVVGYANFMSRYVRDDSPNRTGANGEAFSPDYAAELALADNVGALLDRLDLLLTYGRLESATRTRIAGILEAMTIRPGRENEDRLLRLHMAVQLMVTSSEYITQQ